MDNKPKINLKDLKRTRAEFRVALFPDTVFHLRPINLSDEIWLTETFGDNLESALSSRKSIAQIAWHQLEERHKFIKQKVTFVNDDGDSSEMFIGGFELFATCITSTEEQIEMVKAIMLTFGLSQPILDEITMEQQKKSQTVNQAPQA